MEIGKAALRKLAIHAVELTPPSSNPSGANAPGNVSACGMSSIAAATKPVARTTNARDLNTDACAYRRVAVMISPTNMTASITGMNAGISGNRTLRSGKISKSTPKSRPTIARPSRVSCRSGGVSNNPKWSCATIFPTPYTDTLADRGPRFVHANAIWA